MSLSLDARQRAMLQEMGIRLFWPEPAPAPAAAPPAAAEVRGEQPVQPPPPAPVRPAPVPAPAGRAPSPVAVAEGPGSGAFDALGWEALQQAVLDSRRGAVFGAGDPQGACLVLADGPLEDEERAGSPFVGDAGALLDNMLASVGLSRRRGAYLTHLLKWRGATPDDLPFSEAVLRRQLQLVQPRVILAVGRIAVRTLLQTEEPVGRLRGRLHAWQDVPLVVSYHPSYLLRNLADKGKAWADLCLALGPLRS